MHCRQSLFGGMLQPLRRRWTCSRNAKSNWLRCLYVGAPSWAETVEGPSVAPDQESHTPKSLLLPSPPHEAFPRSRDHALDCSRAWCSKILDSLLVGLPCDTYGSAKSIRGPRSHSGGLLKRRRARRAVRARLPESDIRAEKALFSRAFPVPCRACVPKPSCAIARGLFACG
jgi:hypothetical protein